MGRGRTPPDTGGAVRHELREADRLVGHGEREMGRLATWLIRPEALDVVVERFPEDFDFPEFQPGDAIAGLFHLALEMIARTGRSLALAAPGGKRALAEAAGAADLADDVDLLASLSSIFNENGPARFVDEDTAFLRILRAEYRACVRGQRATCWEAVLGDADDGRGACLRGDACGDARGGGPPADPTRCASYRASWVRTSLAVAGPPPGSPGELAERVLATCPPLGLVTDPAAFHRVIEERFAPPPGSGQRERSVRGLAVRLCSEFVEECLGELSRRLQLPQELAYTLIS